MRLREELFLLGFDNAGRPAVHTDSLDIGVAGARLVELVLAGRVGVAAGRLSAVEEPATGRYVTVWLTSLPQIEGGFRGEIAEASIIGTPAS